ncbi:DUF1435 domain-containing protein [Pseudocitrobacter cyperus]|uniref:DUF1435 domain-containing protein n=1 Tax=Pseudocitrobacter cyperus TaxID=3112843 RepID=A0ABV0HP91_9ENTR
MILVIIIDVRDKTMLTRTLGSGWGVLISGVAMAALGMTGLSMDIWRGIIITGMLMTCIMIWHRQWRHYVLLPSCIALLSGLMLIVMNLKMLE